MNYICDKCGANFSMGEWHGKNVEVKVGRSGPSIGFNLGSSNPWSAESGRDYFAKETVAICDFCNKSFLDRLTITKPSRADYDAKIKADEAAIRKIEADSQAEIYAAHKRADREAEQSENDLARLDEARAQKERDELEIRQKASRSTFIKVMNSATLNPIYTPERGFDMFLDLMDERGFVPRESEYFLEVAKHVIESQAWSTARLQAKVTNDDRILAHCFNDFVELAGDSDRGLFVGNELWQRKLEREVPRAVQNEGANFHPVALPGSNEGDQTNSVYGQVVRTGKQGPDDPKVLRPFASLRAREAKIFGRPEREKRLVRTRKLIVVAGIGVGVLIALGLLKHVPIIGFVANAAGVLLTLFGLLFFGLAVLAIASPSAALFWTFSVDRPASRLVAMIKNIAAGVICVVIGLVLMG